MISNRLLLSALGLAALLSAVLLARSWWERRQLTAALYRAVVANDVRAASRALDEGADISLRALPASDTDPQPPLLVTAVWQGDAGMVRVLLIHGADPNTRTTEGDPVLRAARERHKSEIVRLLLQAGARDRGLLP